MASSPSYGKARERRWNDGDFRMTEKWGWNGDQCAVWGDAIIIGGTRDEKETKARLFAASYDLLALLVESQGYSGGDWRARRDALIERVLGGAQNG